MHTLFLYSNQSLFTMSSRLTSRNSSGSPPKVIERGIPSAVGFEQKVEHAVCIKFLISRIYLTPTVGRTFYLLTSYKLRLNDAARRFWQSRKIAGQHFLPANTICSIFELIVLNLENVTFAFAISSSTSKKTRRGVYTGSKPQRTIGGHPRMSCESLRYFKRYLRVYHNSIIYTS